MFYVVTCFLCKCVLIKNTFWSSFLAHVFFHFFLLSSCFYNRNLALRSWVENFPSLSHFLRVEDSCSKSYWKCWPFYLLIAFLELIICFFIPNSYQLSGLGPLLFPFWETCKGDLKSSKLQNCNIIPTQI